MEASQNTHTGPSITNHTGISTIDDHDVVIVGGGAAGIALASSLLARTRMLRIAIVEPAEMHYYQPGWTMVGAGVFKPTQTARAMASVMPSGVRWVKAPALGFDPNRKLVHLPGGQDLRYQRLAVCTGLKLDWMAIDGLANALGKHGVTSNYRFDLAPYTWELIRKLRSGKALFTQPPMPIKCAGAPQKAMYLACDTWRHRQLLPHIDVQFYNAGASLFGVADYVPALMRYVDQYGIDLRFGHQLQRIDGPRRRATLRRTLADGTSETVESEFDMIHVVPPQVAPDLIRQSAFADAAGWMDVDSATMRHKTFDDVYALGDVVNTTNAKTAAAIRQQAPVVAHNILASLGQLSGTATYDGYGSCPLTVARGKIVLAEFTYGGKLAPTFPRWLLEGTHPSRLAWLLKTHVLPPLYWSAMLKGREWLAKPTITR